MATTDEMLVILDEVKARSLADKGLVDDERFRRIVDDIIGAA
jgi:hypothetical protein